MFYKVMEWLEADDETREEGFGDETTRIAIAALFYHMISVDGVVKAVETSRLRRFLCERFSLNEEQLGQLVQRGEKTDKSSPGLFPFTVILNRELDETERIDLWKQLEDLAYSDGVIQPLEVELLEQMKVMLKVPA